MFDAANRLFGHLSVSWPGLEERRLAPLGQVVAAHDVTIFTDRQHDNPAYRTFMASRQTLQMLRNAGVTHVGLEVPTNLSSVLKPFNLQKLSRELAYDLAVLSDQAVNNIPDQAEIAETSSRYLATTRMIKAISQCGLTPVFCDEPVSSQIRDPIEESRDRCSLQGNAEPFIRLYSSVDFVKGKAVMFYGSSHGAALQTHAQSRGLSTVIVNLHQQTYNLKDLSDASREQMIKAVGGAQFLPTGALETFSRNVHYTISTGAIVDQRPISDKPATTSAHPRSVQTDKIRNFKP